MSVIDHILRSDGRHMTWKCPSCCFHKFWFFALWRRNTLANGGTNCLFMCAKKWNRILKQNAPPQTLGQLFMCDCAVHLPVIIAGLPKPIPQATTSNWLNEIELKRFLFFAFACSFIFHILPSFVALLFFSLLVHTSAISYSTFLIFAKRLHHHH